MEFCRVRLHEVCNGFYLLPAFWPELVLKCLLKLAEVDDTVTKHELTEFAAPKCEVAEGGDLPNRLLHLIAAFQVFGSEED